MQSYKLIKSPNQEREDQNDTPHTSRAGMPSQHFPIELFQYAVGNTSKNNGLSTQFLIDTGARCSIINCDTFTEIEKIQPIILMPLIKINFGCKWTCHAHERESCDSICV